MKFARRLAEDLRVQVDIGLAGRRRHQRHVVKGRQQDPAVERVEMDEAVELGVPAGGGLAAVAGALATEEVLDAAAQARDVPREVVALDHLRDSVLEALAEG